MMESDLEPLGTIGDLDQEWIKEMLSLHFGKPVTVHFYDYNAPTTTEGYMSEIYFLKVVYSDTTDRRSNLDLVIKVLPREMERIEIMTKGGLDKREVLFYRFANSLNFKTLCSKAGLDIKIPKVYYSKYADADADLAVTLIMEDLIVLKYKSGCVKEGSTLNQTKVAVQAVGEFHAAGLAYLKEYGESEVLTELAKEFDFTVFDPYFIRNLESLVAMYKGTPLAEDMKSLIPYTKDILLSRRKYPLLRTVVHGDFWAGQLMFTEDESKVMMIDWQHCNIDNPSSDVLSMLFMSSHPSVLEDHLEVVLECYWKSLSYSAEKFGVSLGVTYQQFRKNIDDLMLFGFMMIGISIPEFIGGGNISYERLRGYVDYLHNKSIVSSYVKKMEAESKNQKV